MRIIDADKLKERIANTADLGGWIGDTITQIKQLAIKYIDSVPSVDMPTWIPCSERLPEREGRYLCTNDELGGWITSINIWLGDHWLYPNEKPIAWMPLPEPYREEKE